MDPLTIFTLDNAVVRRDGREILHVSHFTLSEGERLAIIGPNGAGKSTLIGLLTREIMPLWSPNPPVLFYGQALPEVFDMRKIIGVVSAVMQKQVAVGLSAREVVLGGLFGTLGLPLRTDITPTMRQKATQALKEAGALALASRDMRTLSTGEARRVLLARAIVHDPKILVLDEPCSGLDPSAAYNVRQLCRDLAARSDRTLVLVTHHVEDIVSGIDRIVALREGRIECDGDKKELLTTVMVQELFGVPVTLEERDGEYRLWDRPS